MQFKHFKRSEIELLLIQAENQSCPDEIHERLQWFLEYADTQSASAVCKKFSIARSTFYRWAHRFDPQDLSSLEDHPNIEVAEENQTSRSNKMRSPFHAGILIGSSVTLNAVLIIAFLFSASYQSDTSQLKADVTQREMQECNLTLEDMHISNCSQDSQDNELWSCSLSLKP